MEMGCGKNSGTSSRCIPKLTGASILLALLPSFSCLASTEASSLDPNGNITIKWDVLQWTPDGYVAVVTIYNFQRHRSIRSPGWRLGWTWAKHEVIWFMAGARAIKGDCSRFKGNIPYSCKRDPIVADLPPNTPYGMQIANCCKGGVLNSWGQDPVNYGASFQITVGLAGTTNRTVKVPMNFTLKAPGQGYICGTARIVKPTIFITKDGRRFTQALMTWNVTCTYSHPLSKTDSLLFQDLPSTKAHLAPASGVSSRGN